MRDKRQPLKVIVSSVRGTHVCYDPPTFTRKQVSEKARHLRWRLGPKQCSDYDRASANAFVRYMIEWWLSEY